MTELIVCFAQAAEGGPPAWATFFPIVVIAVLFYVLLIAPERRERSKRDGMIKNLKKNDKVVTVGGIIGHFVSASTDGKQVVLRVDDNTRIHFLTSSITQVLTEDTKPDTAAAGK